MPEPTGRRGCRPLNLASATAAARPSNVRWRILAVLVSASFVSYVLRYNVSMAGPALVADLALTEQQLGYLFAAFTAGYAIFQFPGGLFSDAVGPRRALTIIAVLWGVLTLATSVVPGAVGGSTTLAFVALILVRFLVGVAHAPVFPIFGGATERWFPVGGWGLPNGLGASGLTLGVAASAPLVAWLIGAFGWRVSFVLLAPLGFGVAAIWWWQGRDYPAQHPATNDAELRLIAAGRPAAIVTEDAPPSWRRVLGNRDVLLLTFSYFCMNYIFYLFFNWVYYYLVTVRHFDPQQAGFVTSAQWFAGAVGGALGGYLCDLICRRYGMQRGCTSLIVAGLVAAAVFLFVGTVSTNPLVTVTALAATFFCCQFIDGPYWAATISVGGRHAAAACGVLNTGGNVVGFVNAMLVPLVAAALGWTAALLTGSVLALLGATVWLFIRVERTIAA